MPLIHGERGARPGSTRLLLTAAGCGARSSPGEVAATCDGVACDTPRVPDCKRLTPEAVPLARLAPSSPGAGDVNAFALTADHDHLYYFSEGRIWRVSMKAGAPEALTPAGSGGSRILVSGDTLVWSKQGEIRRMPKTGGALTTAATFPTIPLWTVIGFDILSSEQQKMPAPILITPLFNGTPSELLPSSADTFVYDIGEDGDTALVQRSQDLLTVPLNGDPPAVLTTFSATAARALWQTPRRFTSALGRRPRSIQPFIASRSNPGRLQSSCSAASRCRRRSTARPSTPTSHCPTRTAH